MKTFSNLGLRFAAIAALFAGALATATPPAAAVIGCSNAYTDATHFCVLDDGRCEFLLLVGTYHDESRPWVWYVGYRDGDGNALVFYDRPRDCDNYGVAYCRAHVCTYVAFLGTGSDGPIDELSTLTHIDILPPDLPPDILP